MKEKHQCKLCGKNGMQKKKNKKMNIKPYPKNAKKHPDKQLEQIAKSIQEFGWQQPIVVDEEGTIIVGHGRWEAYEKFKDEFTLPAPEIKTAILTKEQAQAYRLADNKLNESDWDMKLAIDELKELPEDLQKITGFDLDLLIEPDEKDDILPDNPPAIAKLGDLYSLGGKVTCPKCGKCDRI
jgi:ParB-like chromosome segregation protein Spo0J